MIKSIPTIIFLASGMLAYALPMEITGKVVAVVDGNTIEFLSSDNETFRFVLAGIDCPELSQEFGDEAKRHLEKILKGKQATLVIENKDRWGNRVGSLQLSKGADPRIELLEKGLAWTQERNPNLEFETIREQAKTKGIGLWRQENPIAPWIFRRQQSMLSPKMG